MWRKISREDHRGTARDMETKTAKVNGVGTRNELNAKKGQWSAKTHSPKQSSRIEPEGGKVFLIRQLGDLKM